MLPRGACKYYLLQANTHSGVIFFIIFFCAAQVMCIAMTGVCWGFRAATNRPHSSRVEQFPGCHFQLRQTLDPPSFIGTLARFISGCIIHRCQSEAPGRIYHRPPLSPAKAAVEGGASKSNFVLYKCTSKSKFVLQVKRIYFTACPGPPPLPQPLSISACIQQMANA